MVKHLIVYSKMPIFYQVYQQNGTVHQVIPNVVPSNISLAKVVGQYIMVRQCYVELEQLITQEISQANTQQRYARLIIAGTPAVGKSMMLCYIAGKLPFISNNYGINGALILAEKKTHNLNTQDKKQTSYSKALYKWNQSGTYDFFQVYGCHEPQLQEQEVANLRDKGYITLMDGASYLPLQQDQMGHVIIFASPAIDVSDQRQHSFLSYYMPVWSEQEFNHLLTKLPTCQWKSEKEKERMRLAFQQLGGTVRNVFVHDLERQVDDILHVASNATCGCMSKPEWSE